MINYVSIEHAYEQAKRELANELSDGSALLDRIANGLISCMGWPHSQVAVHGPDAKQRQHAIQVAGKAIPVSIEGDGLVSISMDLALKNGVVLPLTIQARRSDPETGRNWLSRWRVDYRTDGDSNRGGALIDIDQQNEIEGLYESISGVLKAAAEVTARWGGAPGVKAEPKQMTRGRREMNDTGGF